MLNRWPSLGTSLSLTVIAVAIHKLTVPYKNTRKTGTGLEAYSHYFLTVNLQDCRTSYGYDQSTFLSVRRP